MAPLCIDIFLKRTGPKKEGLKNNSVYPASCTSWPHSSALAVRRLPGASIRSVEDLLLLSPLCLFFPFPLPLLFTLAACSCGSPPPFHRGLLYSLTSAVTPSSPPLIPPSCPSFPCHAFRAPPPHSLTAVPSEILQELAWCRGWGRLGCWCAVRSANEWCLSSMTHPSRFCPVISLKTLDWFSDHFCSCPPPIRI